MPILSSEAGENKGLLQAARLMLVSARTAPKSGGVDDVLTAIVLGKEKESLADEMDKMFGERKIPGFKRDAKNVRDSAAALLTGVRGTKSFNLDCGACGYASCDEFDEA